MPDNDNGAGSAPIALLTPPRYLLDLVNADLRGKIGVGDRQRLTEDPQRWLGILGSVLRSVEDQMRERRSALDAELQRPVRSEGWREMQTEYDAWLRKARDFQRLVQTRIQQVRTLLPDDDLIALLHDALTLPVPEGPEWSGWRDRARRALGERGHHVA
jgi:hypothetical protein